MYTTSKTTILRLLVQSLVFIGLLLAPTQVTAETGEMFKRMPTQYHRIARQAGCERWLRR